MAREYGFAELEGPQIFIEKYSPYEGRKGG